LMCFLELPDFLSYRRRDPRQLFLAHSRSRSERPDMLVSLINVEFFCRLLEDGEGASACTTECAFNGSENLRAVFSLLAKCRRSWRPDMRTSAHSQ